MQATDPFLWLITTVIDMYSTVVIVAVIASLLISFNVLNTSNRVVYIIYDFLNRLTEPALSRIRRYMPDLGGIDISPVILILGLSFTKYLVVWVWPL